MVYNLVILPNAELEIQEAYEYYKSISNLVFINFDNQLEEVYQNLEIIHFIKQDISI